MSRSYAKTRFSANDAALALIDHQSGIMQLVHVAQRITRTREDAEDAVQDTLLRAFVHLGDFEGRSSFGIWLMRIAINSALMILRNKLATRETAMGDNNAFGDGLRYETTDHAPNPETRYAQRRTENSEDSHPASTPEPPSRGSDSPARTFNARNSTSIRHLFVSSQITNVSGQEGPPQVGDSGSWWTSLDLPASYVSRVQDSWGRPKKGGNRTARPSQPAQKLAHFWAGGRRLTRLGHSFRQTSVLLVLAQHRSSFSRL